MRAVFHKWIALIVLGLALAGCGTTPRQVIMDGRDATGAKVDPINLFASYQPRGRVVGQARHGEAVDLIRQSGDGCEVRTTAGAQGWVTCSNFIREFK